MPRKIEYAKEKEQILFESLNSLASLKQEELRNIINNAIETNREQILDASRNYEFVDVELMSSGDFVEISVGDDQLTKPSEPGDIFIESQGSGSSSSSKNSVKTYQTVKYARDYKKCTNQIQELVLNKLNNAIAQKLTESIEILKENYIGTLKRCLKNLEDANNISVHDAQSASVSEALQQVTLLCVCFLLYGTIMSYFVFKDIKCSLSSRS
jgi:receptor-interacting serine/threonine-protein kinase 5